MALVSGRKYTGIIGKYTVQSCYYTVPIVRKNIDLNIRFLGDLQQTQTRLQNAERTNTEQSEKIKKLERDLKVANPKRGGLSTKEQPSIGAAKTVGTASLIESKQTLVCESFSDDNYYVTVSSCKRSVNGRLYSYCFLNHPTIKKNQILKWSLRIPKFRSGLIGMVIFIE